MNVKLSSKGQLVLPSSIRNRFGFKPGEQLSIDVEGDKIIITRDPANKPKAYVSTDEETGLPLVCCEDKTSPITTEQINQLLVDFP